MTPMDIAVWQGAYTWRAIFTSHSVQREPVRVLIQAPVCTLSHSPG